MRLINADEVVEKVKISPDNVSRLYVLQLLSPMYSKTIDAVPVRNGRWQFKEYNEGSIWKSRCSECGFEMDCDGSDPSDSYRFCPYCAARMGGDPE